MQLWIKHERKQRKLTEEIQYYWPPH